MSTTRHTARRCAVQRARDDVLGRGRRARSASRRPACGRGRGRRPAAATGRAAGCRGPAVGPTRPSCTNTRAGQPPRRGAQRRVGGDAPCRPAAPPRPPGLRRQRRRTPAASSSPTSGETSSNAGCCCGELLAAVGARRPAPGRAASGAGSPAGSYPAGLGFSPASGAVRRSRGVGGPQPVEQLVDHRLRASVAPSATRMRPDSAARRRRAPVSARRRPARRERGQAGQHQRPGRSRRAPRSPSARPGARGWPGSARRQVDPAPGQPARPTT